MVDIAEAVQAAKSLHQMLRGIDAIATLVRDAEAVQAHLGELTRARDDMRNQALDALAERDARCAEGLRMVADSKRELDTAKAQAQNIVADAIAEAKAKARAIVAQAQVEAGEAQDAEGQALARLDQAKSELIKADASLADLKAATKAEEEKLARIREAIAAATKV